MSSLFATEDDLTGNQVPVAPTRWIGDDKSPLVVMYHGKPEGAPYEWNTGVWPAWGEHIGDMYQKVIPQRLRWQAEGAFVMKTCDVHCHISHDQSLVPQADAVVMELINHYKFFGRDTSLTIPWPEGENGRDLILGMFHYESESEYPMLLEPEIRDRIDFTVIPKPDADVPISLICPWGFPESQYLEFSPEKITYTANEHVKYGPVYVADFRGTIPPGYESYFSELKSLLNIDFFGGPYKNAKAPEPYILSERISHMGEYMFVIIAEGIIEDDWICPEYSQALLSGAVPIYIGAPNIDEYLPGENAIVHMRDFETPQELATYIETLGSDKVEYENRHLQWKSQGLSDTFRKHISHCAHLAECRICKKVLSMMPNNN